MSPQREPDFFQMGTSVPLFTGDVFSSMYFIGFGWSFIVAITTIFTDFLLDGIRWFTVTLLVAFLVHLAAYWLKRNRFENPVTSPEFLKLVDEVTRDLATGQEIEFWQRNVDRQIFASTVNQFYKAILVSESTISDLLGKPDKARAILAREILEMEKKHPLSRMLGSVLVFVMFAFMASALLSEDLVFSLFSLGPAVIVTLVIGVIATLAAMPILATREDTNLDKRVEELYGIPPDAARLEVFVGVSVPQELIDEVKREEEEGPSQRDKALRVAPVITVIVIPVAFFLMSIATGLDSSSDVLFTTLMSAVIGVGAFVITFMLVLMWPMIKPDNEPRDTSSDFQDDFTEAVQRFINQEEGFETVIVRGVQPPFDSDAGLVVFGIDLEGRETTLEVLMPHTLKDLRDPKQAGSLLVSEMKRDRIEKHVNRFSYAFLGIGLLVLIFGLVLPIIREGPYFFLQVFVQVLLLYIVITFVPLVGGMLWKRRADILSDAEVATNHPEFIQALRILASKHHSLPYGITSYKTRLERTLGELWKYEEYSGERIGLE